MNAINAKSPRQRKQRSKRALLHDLVDYCKNPQQLFELYYWSAEPQLAHVMRSYVMLPSTVQEAIHAFFKISEDHLPSVAVHIGLHGELILSSRYAAEIVQRIRPNTRHPSETAH